MQELPGTVGGHGSPSSTGCYAGVRHWTDLSAPTRDSSDPALTQDPDVVGRPASKRAAARASEEDGHRAVMTGRPGLAGPRLAQVPENPAGSGSLDARRSARQCQDELLLGNTMP